MAVCLRAKEVAREKGISMGKLHRQADVSYKTIKRIYSDPFYATATITLGKLASAHPRVHVKPSVTTSSRVRASQINLFQLTCTL
jgi:lambda repressor-like predicted transcriptional regulator